MGFSLISAFSATTRRWIATTLMLALSLMTGGCMAHGTKVNVVVFNYTPTPLGEVTIQGNYIGGYYQAYADGTGGKIYCCIDVRSGHAALEWTYGGEEGAPKAGTQATAAGEIPKPAADDRYLGVHVYPDEKVEYTMTRDIPEEKKQEVR